MTTPVVIALVALYLLTADTAHVLALRPLAVFLLCPLLHNICAWRSWEAAGDIALTRIATSMGMSISLVGGE